MKKSPVICIIGSEGKMGAWFKNFFESQGISVQPVGSKTKDKAARIRASDIIIVAVPITKTELVLKDTMPHVREDALLCDITSLKVFPLKIMENAGCGTLGMHPLFGPSISITKGHKVIFCRQKDNEYVQVLKNYFEKAGLSVIEMSADEHDYHMAYIQGLTHAINLLYAKILFDQKDALSKKLNTPLFMLQSIAMGRILHQDLGLTADIQLYNPYFTPLVENLAAYSKQLANILQKNDKKAFIELFQEDVVMGKEFANFSMLHSNKILGLVSEIHGVIPLKTTKVSDIKKSPISFLGPEGTYSHEAAKTIFSNNTYFTAKDTIFKVFESVLDDETEYGIVPAENSIEGTVKGTLDYLVDFSLFVVGSFIQPIHHQLATEEKNLKNIKTVISHPQAIAQCELWIRKNIPHATIVLANSTTAEISKERKNSAFICSSLAAKLYGLPILAKDIEDNPQNTTKFYVVSKKSTTIPQLDHKHTLLFLTVYNRVGILRDILNIMADHGLNLTKLESRPSYEKTWDYHFFVEVDASQSNPSLQKALSQLEKYCPIVRVLGQT